MQSVPSHSLTDPKKIFCYFAQSVMLAMAVDTQNDSIHFQPKTMCFGSLKIASKIDHFGCILRLPGL